MKYMQLDDRAGPSRTPTNSSLLSAEGSQPRRSTLSAHSHPSIPFSRPSRGEQAARLLKGDLNE